MPLKFVILFFRQFDHFGGGGFFIITFWEKRLKWIFSSLVFFAFPIWLVCFSLNRFWSFQESESLDSVFKKLDSVIFSIARNKNTEIYLAKVIQKVFRKVQKSGGNRLFLEKAVLDLKSRFPEVFRITLVDGSGEVIEELSDGSPPRFVLKKLYRTIRKIQGIRNSPKSYREKEIILKSSWNLVKSFIGLKASIDQFLSPLVSFLEVSYLDRDRWFFYRADNNLGMFVHASNVQNWPYLSLSDVCSNFKKDKNPSKILVGMKTEKTARMEFPELSMAFMDFDRNLNSHQIKGNSLFSIFQNSPTLSIWASCSAQRVENFDRMRILGAFLGTLIFSFFLIISHQILVMEKKFRISIKWRLITLFAFVGGIPTSIIILTGWDYLNQVFKSRLSQESDSNEEVLKSFDSGFPKMIALIGERLVGFLKKNAIRNSKSQKKVFQTLRKIYNLLEKPDLAVVDREGKTVWGIASPQPKMAKVRSSYPTFAPVILANLNQEKGDPAIIQGYGSSEWGIKELLTSLGEISELKIAGIKRFQWLFPIFENTGRAAYLVILQWPRTSLEHLYLKKFLTPHQKKYPEIKIVAIDSSDFNLHFPRFFKNIGSLRKIFANISLIGGTVIDAIRINRENFLVTSIKPKNLFGTILIALKPISMILKEVSLGKKLLWVFVAVFAVISLFLGIFLSRSFLVPISNLAMGINAMETRNFDFRISEGRTNELGTLGRLFNATLAGMKELEVAKIVQKNLFPSEQIKIGDFRLFGASKMLSQVGGDYFDYFLLPKGEILILIGDVSGHGVQASLAMAMAKAVVVGRLVQGIIDESGMEPNEVLVFLQETLFQTIKLKGMITCFIGVLNTFSNIFKYSNAGHNFPFILRENQPPRQIQIEPSRPLTGRRKTIFPLNCVELQPGDRIVFYTDGFVESKALDGFPIGYERASQAIGSLTTLAPVESYDSLIAWHQSETGTKFQEDDITILILSRLKQE